MTMTRTTWILIAILLVGALLRGFYLAEFRHSLSFAMPEVDAGYHDFWARALATGNWTPPPIYNDPEIHTMPFFRPPGYPYFLALLYKLTGASYLWARILQMLVGLASVVLGFVLARRWLGERTGLIFAAFMAMYWSFIYFEGEFLEPVLLIFLSLALIYELSLWTERITFRRALLTGLIMGIFALVRPNVLLFAPVAVLWALWVLRRRDEVRRIWIGAVGLGLGAAIAISPAAIRNYLVSREFVPISTNGGINLFIGNNPTANGRVTGIIPGLGMFETCFDYPLLKRNLEARLGGSMTHTEFSKYFSDQAITFVKEHPLDALRLTGTRALLFWGPKEVGHNKEDELERANSRILKHIPGRFPSALGLAVLGTAIWLVGVRRRKSASSQDLARDEVLVLVLLFVLTYFVSYLPFFVAGRYRVPVVPFMLLLGAYGVDRLIALVVERRFAQVGIWAALLVGPYALACVNFTGYEPDRAFWHFNRGVHYRLADRVDEAAGEYAEALKIKPDLPQPNINLGLIYAESGRPDEAIPLLERALIVLPDNPWAHYGMGIALLSKGDLDRGVRELQTAVHLDPDLVAGHDQLGLMYASRGMYGQAAAEFEAIVKLDPGNASAHYNLALALERLRYLDPAITEYRNALKLRPDMAKAHKNLAVLLCLKGDYSGAWQEVDLCRRYGGTPHPKFIAELQAKKPRR